MASLSSVLAYTTLAFLAISPTAQGLGINCRGSGYCTWNDDKNTYEARTLTYFINGIDSGRWYNNGEHIACTPSGICAFLQKTGGTWGSKIKELAHYIPDHGCTICGSVPYYFPDGNNNVDDGMLTYNYVSSPKCKNGLC